MAHVKLPLCFVSVRSYFVTTISSPFLLVFFPQTLELFLQLSFLLFNDF